MCVINNEPNLSSKQFKYKYFQILFLSPSYSFRIVTIYFIILITVCLDCTGMKNIELCQGILKNIKSINKKLPNC